MTLQTHRFQPRAVFDACNGGVPMGGFAHTEVVAQFKAAAGGSCAETHHRDAMLRAQELGLRPLVAHCHLGLGKLYRRSGNREQAQEHLTTATTMYGDMGMTYWLEQLEAEMKELA